MNPQPLVINTVTLSKAVPRKETWDHKWEEDLIGFKAGYRDLSHHQDTNLAISNKKNTPLNYSE